MAETPDGPYWCEASSSRCLLLAASGGLSGPSAQEPCSQSPYPYLFPTQVPRWVCLTGATAQLHHCQQVLSKLCTKNSRRLFTRELSQDPGAAEPMKRSPLPVGACLYFHSGLYQTFSRWMKTPRQPEWLSPSDAEFSQNSHCCQGRREFSLLPRLSWAFGNRHFSVFLWQWMRHCTCRLPKPYFPKLPAQRWHLSPQGLSL